MRDYLQVLLLTRSRKEKDPADDGYGRETGAEVEKQAVFSAGFLCCGHGGFHRCAGKSEKDLPGDKAIFV